MKKTFDVIGCATCIRTCYCRTTASEFACSHARLCEDTSLKDRTARMGQKEVLINIYHGLYGSTSCCISHGPSQWERTIFDPPQLGDP